MYKLNIGKSALHFESLFCHCYNIHAYNGSDCGFGFIDFIKLKDL